MKLISTGKQIDKQSILNDLSAKDKVGRTVFHKCCLDQNPRLLELNLFKVAKNTIKDSDIQREENTKFFLN